jgi:hypothetical protein
MTSYADLTAAQIAAIRQIFDVLSAHHGRPFAAEFLEEFWSQALAAVLENPAT